MAAVEMPRVPQGHDPLHLSDGGESPQSLEVPQQSPHPRESPSPGVVRQGAVQDEDELGIYEDNAECADLTDSELEDPDTSQLATNSKRLKSSFTDEGFSMIQEEDEIESTGDDGVSETQNTKRELSQGSSKKHLDDMPVDLPQETNDEDRDIKSPSFTNTNLTKLSLPHDLHEYSDDDGCYGVRIGPSDDNQSQEADPGDRSLVSVSQDNLLVGDKPTSANSTERAGVRGKANTPVSFITEATGIQDSGTLGSRDVSRMLGVESRDAMYKQAMNIMSARCLSKQMEENPWMNPFGIPDPQYFYIEQDKPTPMPPLKAWRGYNGNVYFEPIKVSSVRGGAEAASDLTSKNSQSRSRISYSDLGGERGGVSRTQASPYRSTSQPTGKYPVKVSTSINTSGVRQMSVLDKTTVLNRFNNTIHEDLAWIEGQENTGTLAVNTRRKKEKSSDEPPKLYRDRVCKGLVSHKQGALRRKKVPQFSVAGDKFIPPPSTSPLLRTLTQYSLSTARAVNNSPEHGYEKLPPLEHIKATLRSINNSHEDPYRKPPTHSRHSAIRGDYKPLVKYSPDVRAKYEKHRTRMA